LKAGQSSHTLRLIAAGENGIEFDRAPIDPAHRAHAPRLQSATPSEYRRTCYSHRSISGAKTISRPTTSDEQQLEMRLSLEAQDFAQIRRFQKP
ncbi:MAG: hypothetical protein AAAC48_24275, partial [Phyllobacterium sp.]|uniref:hypothetical protein n=1 Tax=Phyllobacterium sp. TaxID=1871046 RepID=UPI0030EFDE72